MSQTERVFDILYQLSRENGSIRLSDIADRYEISTRQAGRDIEYVRYRILPDPEMIVYDRKLMAYRLAAGEDILSGWREQMLVSFAVMGAMAGSMVGKDEIDSALPQSMRRILSHIDYRTPVRSHGEDEKWLSPVFEAFDKGLSLYIVYRKTPDSAAEERHADPLKLVNYQGFWYLLAYDRGRHGIRTFRLSRAEKVEVSPQRQVSSNMAIDNLLEASYGIFIGPDEPEWYTMRFSGDAGIRVSSEVWHPEQKGRWIDGSYELSIPAASPVELLARLLSFGSEAEPVAPESFCREYWNTVSRMAGRAESDDLQ